MCGCMSQNHFLMQDLVPPLLALIAASAEVNAARNAPTTGRGMTPSRNSLASMTGFRRAGPSNLRAFAWAAGASLLACLIQQPHMTYMIP
jgi:hypothetical protein